MDILIPFIVFSMLAAIGIRLCGLGLEPSEQLWLKKMLLIAVAVRLLAATLFAAAPATRMFHEDASAYEQIGMDLAASWAGRGPPIRLGRANNFGFYYVSGAVYFLFGPFKANLSYFNTLVGAGTMMMVYRMARRLFHRLVARRATLFVGFFPSMILWSSIALKDALMSLLIVLSLYACILLKERFTLTSVLGIVSSILAIQTVRFYMFYFVAFAVLTSLFINRGLGLVTGIYKQLLLCAAVVALLTLVGLAGGTIQGTEFLTLEKASSFRHGMAVTAQSGFSHGVDVSTPLKALLFLPTGIAVLLLGPFPWQFSTLRSLFAAPETILWWFMIPSLLRGIAFAIKKQFAKTSPLLIFNLVLVCGYALVQGNIGSAFRQRAQIFNLLFVFVALGSYVKTCRKAGISQEHLLTTR